MDEKPNQAITVDVPNRRDILYTPHGRGTEVLRIRNIQGRK